MKALQAKPQASEACEKPETQWNNEGFLEINEPYESDEEETKVEPIKKVTSKEETKS